MAKIIAFAGSARRDSWNKKLIAYAAAQVTEAGGEVTLIDLRDFPLPLYDGDLEEADGLPPNAIRLKKLMGEHQGLLLSCPEYNSSITPLLKNVIDWLSRPLPNEASLAAFRGKVAGLLSASTGGLGGIRGLVHVRSILGNIGVLVLPTQVAVPSAHKAFSSTLELESPQLAEKVAALAAELVATVTSLNR
jgi:NAD(P)H-dependent FMN reductase